jgi:glycosyltransferase involved in cell wall biosynthesis
MSSAAPLTFSVIIPTYNRAAILERTLRHLITQDYPPEAYEIILVDNSSDSTPEMAERITREAQCAVRFLHLPERLPAIKRNIGLKAARMDYALFFNDDVWAEPDLIAEHAREQAAWDEPVAVLGRVVQSREMPYDPFLAIFEPFPYFEIGDRAHQAVPYRYFWTMNLSVPTREMRERNLIFHEDWREIGHEDVELGYRWVKAGRKIIYNPGASGQHFHPQTLDSACPFVEGMGRGLRDLEELVSDPLLLERYAIFSWRNRPRVLLRMLVREALYNGLTVPLLKTWLRRRTRLFPLAGWLYWKVLIYHFNRGYRGTPRRTVQPLPILSPDAASRPIVDAP